MYNAADLFIIMIIEQLFSNRQNNFHYYLKLLSKWIHNNTSSEGVKKRSQMVSVRSWLAI